MGDAKDLDRRGDDGAGGEGSARVDRGELGRAAAESRGVGAEHLEPGGGGAAKEAARGGRVLERGERHHAAQLLGRAARTDVLEVPAHVLALLHGHVAAEQHGGDQLAARGGLRVDLLGHELTEDEAALGVADEHHTTALVVLPEVGPPRLAHVVVRDGRLGGRPATAEQGRERHLPVHGRIDAAVLGVARRLVERDRALLRVDPLGRQGSRLVADRGIYVEAVEARRVRGLRLRHAHLLARRREDRGAEARGARVALLARLAQPDRLRRDRGRGDRHRGGHRQHEDEGPGDSVHASRRVAGRAAPLQPSAEMLRPLRAGPVRPGAD